MRILDADGTFAAEVAGTTVGDRLEVNVWRDGLLLVQDLHVTSWSLGWDAGRQIQGQASFTVADDTGELAPWSLADPLSPGGSRLQVTFVSGITSTVVPLGWWRIRRAEPLERWRLWRLQQAAAKTLRRTNAATVPIASTGVAPWSWQNGTTEVTTASVNTTTGAGPQGRTGFARRTVTTAKTTGNSGHFYREAPGAGATGAADEVWSGGIWVRSSAAVTVAPSLSFRSGATALGGGVGPAVVLAPNVWTFVKVEGIAAPAAFDGWQLFAASSSVVPIGGTSDATDVILERAATLGGAYFDGSLDDTRGSDYAWTGTANASASTVSTPAVEEIVERVAGGGLVTIEADEETATIVLSRLDAEVVRKPTVIDELTRLLADIVPVSPAPGLPDGPVPAGFVYGDSRLDAVEDLLAAIFAVYRIGPDGSLELVPAAGVGPVWTVEGGDEGVLVSLVRALSDDGVYNGAVSMGETATGQPLVGRAYIEGGTLAWGGPFGRVPIFHSAVAQTSAGVAADAQTVLATLSSAGDVDLAVVCLTHPGIQLHDLVTLVASTTAGGMPLVGRVVAMSMRSAGGDTGVVPGKTMSMTVRVSAAALEVIGRRVRDERG